MSVVREVYDIRLEPGANVEKAVAKLSKYIIDRWMPDNAGGIVVMQGPALCELIYPIWRRVNENRKGVTLRINTTQPRVKITEMP
jgi:hypothetical protein